MLCVCDSPCTECVISVNHRSCYAIGRLDQFWSREIGSAYVLGVAIRRGDIKGDDAWLLDDRYCALSGIRDTWVRHGLALACRAVLEIARCAKEMIPSGRKGPFKILLVTENVGPLEAIVR